MDIYCVPIETVDDIWSKVEHFFKRVLKKHDTEFTLEDLKELVLSGKWKLFACVDDNNHLDGAFVVSFITHPRAYVAFVTCIGGKAIANPAYYEKFLAILKAYGANRVQGYVSASVERLYKRLGIMCRTAMLEIKL